MSLNPFSLSLVSVLHQQRFLEAEHAAGKSPCSKTQRLTPYDKSLEAEQKQTENSHYLNDRAHWQAGRQAGGRLAQTQSIAASWPGATEDEANSGIQRQ